MFGLSMDKAIVALPFQLLDFDGALVIRRGMTEVKITGDNAFEIVKIIQVALQKSTLTVRDTIELFSALHHEPVAKILELLLNKKLIIYCDGQSENFSKPESPEDIFYWHFNHSVSGGRKGRNVILVFCGLNNLILGLARRFKEKGDFNIVLVDDPLLRDPTLFENDKLNADLRTTFNEIYQIEEWQKQIFETNLEYVIIAGTDAGNFNYLKDWNAFCFEKNITFFPVLVTQMRGYIGPFILPGSTPCLECLTHRINSHARNFQDNEALRQSYLKEGRILFEAYHSSMLLVTCQTAIFELERYLYGITGIKFGQLMEINLLASSLESHRVLKAPRCKVCTPLNKRPALMLLKRLASIETWSELEKTGSV